jgi:Domain of unknown function (DUF4331)
MSNHFTGLNLGFPQGDSRLDLTDLYAFPSPEDGSRTVLALNANTFARAPDFHPDAVYRINVDNDGDSETDIAFSFVFSPFDKGRQSVTVRRAEGVQAQEDEAVGETLFDSVEVSFGPEPNIVESGPYRFFAGVRSDPFVLDFVGATHEFAWTGTDLFVDQNVFALILELPTVLLEPGPLLGIWGRVSVRRDGELVVVDRAGHPAQASFFNTDETKEEYNAAHPAHDVERFTDQFVEVLEHIGGYSIDDAKAAINKEGLLPDLLTFDPTLPAGYPNGRTLTDHVVAARMALLSKGTAPDDGLKPHTDLTDRFPYLGTPHREVGELPAYGVEYRWVTPGDNLTPG